MAIISRRQYDHPALATAGGSALHASISNLYTVLGDDSMSRYKTFTAVANSSVGVIAHEFGLDFANLKVQIFTGTYPALTLVSDPIGTGWTVAATSGLASRSIDVTAPASGGPHTYAVLVSHESNATAFIPGLVSIGAQSFAGPKTFTGTLFGTDTTDSSSSTTGAFKTAGGLGVAKALFVGTTLNTAGATTLGSSTGALTTINTVSASAGVRIANGSGATVFDIVVTNGTGTSFDSYSGVVGRSLTFRTMISSAITSVGGHDSAGAWTFGPTSASPAHIFNITSASSTFAQTAGQLSICNSTGSGHQPAIVSTTATNNLAGLFLVIGSSDTNSSADLVFNVRTSGGVDFSTLTNKAFSWQRFGTEIGYATRAGAWTLGPLSAGANYSGQRHLISGGLHAANATSADGSGRLVIGVNSYRYGNTSDNARTNTATGGMGILLDNRTLNANPGLEIYASQPGQSLTTSAVIASAQHDGAWTLGDTSVVNSRHTINGGISVLTARSSFMDDEPYALAVRHSTASGTSFFIGATSVGDLQFSATGGGSLGGITQAGAWTLGPSSTTTYHTVNGTLLSKAAANGFQSAFAAQDVLRLTANIYLDLGSNTERNIAAGVGYAALEINRPAADTDVVYRFRSNYQDTQNAAGSSLVITNNKTLGTVTAAGAWTLGAGSSSQTHTVNGNNISLVGSNSFYRLGTAGGYLGQADGPGSFFTGTIGGDTLLVGQGNLWLTAGAPSSISSYMRLKITSTPTIDFLSTSNAVLGTVNSSGAWTLGPPAGLADSHLIRRSAGSGAILTVNQVDTGSARNNTIEFQQNSVSQYAIGQLLNDSLNFRFYAGTTSGTILGEFTNAGAWTLGAASGAQTHILNAAKVTLALPATGGSIDYSANSQSWHIGNIGSSTGSLGGTNSIYFYDNTGSKFVGGISTAGAWYLGVDSTGGRQIVSLTTNGSILSYADTSFVGNKFISTTATAGSGTPIVQAQYNTDTDCTGGYFYQCLNSAGTSIGRIQADSNTTTSFVGTSDERLKQNPTDFDGLPIVMAILPREYEWKSNPEKRKKGFYAQELYKVLPEAVGVGNDDVTEDGSLKTPWGIDYGKLTPVLVKAIQELSAKNDALEARLAALES